ncbi:unnamed protein product [Ilex paraguariensis]|uniref:Uncharacterized protein n=1 Tax=Ilex paraguariensis TaxID=185542 RepID=A0ABC8U2B2_9AQUA
MVSWSKGEGSSSLPMVGAEKPRCSTDDPHPIESKAKGWQNDIYTQLWLACAGPLVNVPHAGDKVYYFPQGHLEQVEAYMNQDDNVEMPIYNLPSKILCKVVYIHLQVLFEFA